MNVAIIGLGNIGKIHAEIIKEQGENLVAVCDINTLKLKNYTCKKYNDYTKLLNEEDIDIVHICTPHYLHSEMIIYALKKGINVLCEKPLCIKESDIPKILKAEEESSAILGICHQNRYNAANQYVKKYLSKEDIIGGWGSVVWHRDYEYYKQDDWRGKALLEGGGVLINQALHTLDLLQWFIGEPKYVTAIKSNFNLKNKIEVEDSILATYSGNGNFTFMASNCGEYDFPVVVTIKTKEHLITVMGNHILIDNTEMILDNPISCHGKECYGFGHVALISDFYNCVKYKKKFTIDGKEAAKVVKMILATYKSEGDKINI